MFSPRNRWKGGHGEETSAPYARRGNAFLRLFPESFPRTSTRCVDESPCLASVGSAHLPSGVTRSTQEPGKAAWGSGRFPEQGHDRSTKIRDIQPPGYRSWRGQRTCPTTSGMQSANSLRWRLCRTKDLASSTHIAKKNKDRWTVGLLGKRPKIQFLKELGNPSI